MANIAITKYCNLKCPYCFADDMIRQADDDRYISLERYIEILQWLGKDNDNFVGIIGGEPTLHPQFEEILKITNAYCNKYNTNSILFTNGVNLKKYIDLLFPQLSLLINVNSPQVIGKRNWNELIDTLTNLIDKPNQITLGCNIYPGLDDYQFIFDLAYQFDKKSVRCSVVSPGGMYKDKINNRDDYFKEMKPIFMNFVRTAAEYGIILNNDCAQIPDCYFTQSELELIYSISENRHHGTCEPVVDIDANFMATACFGSYDLVDCTQFDTVTDLKRYLKMRKMFKLIEANDCTKCKNCKKLELLDCQGGCLGFNHLT